MSGLPQKFPIEVGPPCFIMSLSFLPECSNYLARPPISLIQRYHTRMIHKLVPTYSPSLCSRPSNGSSLSTEPDYLEWRATIAADTALAELGIHPLHLSHLNSVSSLCSHVSRDSPCKFIAPIRVVADSALTRRSP